MSYLFVPGTGDSNWDFGQRCLMLERSCTWKGKRMPVRYWRRVCAAVPWMQRLSGRILPPSTAERGVERWIASVPDSRASRSALRASGRGLTTTDGFGPTSPGSLAKWNPNGFFSKMSLDLFLAEDLNRFSGPWPKCGSMRNGIISAQQKSARPTSGSGCSLWPTAKVSTGAYSYSGGDSNKPVLNLEGKAELWPTPAGRGWGDGRASDATMERNARPLNEMVGWWPTPRGSEWKGTGPVGSKSHTHREKRFYLDAIASRFSHRDRTTTTHGRESSQKGQTSRRRLNPRFVEWLMGLPENWLDAQTNLEPGAMESWCSRLHMRLQSLLKD